MSPLHPRPGGLLGEDFPVMRAAMNSSPDSMTTLHCARKKRGAAPQLFRPLHAEGLPSLWGWDQAWESHRSPGHSPLLHMFDIPEPPPQILKGPYTVLAGLSAVAEGWGHT